MNTVAAALLAALFAVQAGCQSCRSERSEPAPTARQITGLDAIPGDVAVLVGAEVEALRDSWLVKRAIAQMFRRDPGLAQRIDQLIDACNVNPAEDLDSVVIGLGSGAGADDAVMVVTGAFVEADLARCVSQSVAQDGGTLTVEQVDGRSIYDVLGSSTRADRVWFTVAGPRTLVVATSRDLLGRAVGDGAKAHSSRDLQSLLARVDRTAGLWAVGQVDAQIGAGLVELSGGQIANPPQSMFVELSMKSGLELSFGAVMASESDAKSLVSKIKSQLQVGMWVLQAKGFGLVAQKLGVDADRKTVYLRLSLDDREVKEVLARIDTAARSHKDPASN